MSTFSLSAVLGIAILGVLAVRATIVVRRERGAPRGSLPGKGHHVIEANYFSGGAGGGHSASYKVPKDPQAYARLFVPRDRD
ncbi:hypothetical protein DXV76_12600 [Rhodobacteraceae bacterium CCMM004]|nr:hypothetical protein DXV76_12600 [Rhodobacteraceae bacterium CCMM004]